MPPVLLAPPPLSVCYSAETLGIMLPPAPVTSTFLSLVLPLPPDTLGLNGFTTGSNDSTAKQEVGKAVAGSPLSTAREYAPLPLFARISLPMQWLFCSRLVTTATVAGAVTHGPSLSAAGPQGGTASGPRCCAQERPCAQSTGEAFPLRLADIRQHDVFLFWPSRDEGIKRATKRQAQLTWEAMV